MHPVLVKIGPFVIRYYGVMYVVAIIVGIFLTWREVKRKKLNLALDDILDFVLITIPIAIIFARLYYVAFQWGYYRDNLVDIVKIWQGGLAIHGGLIGGAIALWIFSAWKRLSRISIWAFADAMAPSLILGQAFGRFGNFMNGDAYGIPTNLPWGLRFPANTPAAGEGGINVDPNAPGWTLPLHPAMLYELIGCLIIFGILWWLRRKDYKDGFLASIYFMSYSVLRIMVEFFRGDALLIPGTEIRIAQIISAFILLIFGWLVLGLQLYQRKASEKVKAR